MCRRLTSAWDWQWKAVSDDGSTFFLPHRRSAMAGRRLESIFCLHARGICKFLCRSRSALNDASTSGVNVDRRFCGCRRRWVNLKFANTSRSVSVYILFCFLYEMSNKSHQCTLSFAVVIGTNDYTATVIQNIKRLSSLFAQDAPRSFDRQMNPFTIPILSNKRKCAAKSTWNERLFRRKLMKTGRHSCILSPMAQCQLHKDLLPAAVIAIWIGGYMNEKKSSLTRVCQSESLHTFLQPLELEEPLADLRFP